MFRGAFFEEVRNGSTRSFFSLCTSSKQKQLSGMIVRVQCGTPLYVERTALKMTEYKCSGNWTRHKWSPRSRLIGFSSLVRFTIQQVNTDVVLSSINHERALAYGRNTMNGPVFCGRNKVVNKLRTPKLATSMLSTVASATTGRLRVRFSSHRRAPMIRRKSAKPPC